MYQNKSQRVRAAQETNLDKALGPQRSAPCDTRRRIEYLKEDLQFRKQDNLKWPIIKEARNAD
jgi:uncharacterized membrane protein YgaE (UPF0421/DUF939 family)